MELDLDHRIRPAATILPHWAICGNRCGFGSTCDYTQPEEADSIAQI